MPSLPSFMRIHGLRDVEAWAKRHHVEPQEVPCPGCGETRRTTIPIVTDSIGTRTYGLQCPPCECGEPFQPYTYLLGKEEHQ
jgi:hypothetical protein